MYIAPQGRAGEQPCATSALELGPGSRRLVCVPNRFSFAGPCPVIGKIGLGARRILGCAHLSGCCWRGLQGQLECIGVGGRSASVAAGEIHHGMYVLCFWRFAVSMAAQQLLYAVPLACLLRQVCCGVCVCVCCWRALQELPSSGCGPSYTSCPGRRCSRVTPLGCLVYLPMATLRGPWLFRHLPSGRGRTLSSSVVRHRAGPSGCQVIRGCIQRHRQTRHRM